MHAIALADVSGEDSHISICVSLMQEVGVHVMAPAKVLLEDPLPHAVAVQPLREVATASQNGGHSLPPGADRFAVTIDGTETEEEVASLKSSEAVMALLNIAPGVSRVHASRRIFELLQRHEIDISVIHFRRWACLPLPFPRGKNTTPSSVSLTTLSFHARNDMAVNGCLTCCTSDA